MWVWRSGGPSKGGPPLVETKFKQKDTTMRQSEVYGVKMTSLEALYFQKWRANNNHRLPAPNTITADERKKMVSDWLENHRTKNIPNEG